MSTNLGSTSGLTCTSEKVTTLDSCPSCRLVWRVLRWSGRKPDCECGQSANGEHYKHEEELHKVELERLVSIVNQRPLATKTIYKPEKFSGCS